MESARSPSGLVMGADRAAFVAAFVNRLRGAGVATGHDSARAFTRALDALGAEAVTNRQRVYWLARITLVRHPQAISTFDEVFAAIFESAVFSLDPAALRNSARGRDDERNVPTQTSHAMDDGENDSGLPWATLPRMIDEGEDDDGAVTPVWIPRPTSRSALADVPFDRLSPAQLREVEHWLDAAAPRWPKRRSRRQRVRSRGHEIDLRRTLELARRTGFEVVELARRAPVWRDRRIVMVCDVSQSMQPYTRAYLHLMRAISSRNDGETFAFATSLTRMTALLAHRSVDDAVERASAVCTDRFGGTRIASSLHGLLRSRHAQTLRGAIVIVASDGWDSDPPERMTAMMAAIGRRAHRVIWLNPRASQPGYQPLVAGMAAALPFCDEFLPAATVTDLESVVAAITATGALRSRA